MNWEAIGAVGEVGGAVAVVGTLVYLAAQIRHSSDSTRASTQLALMSEFNRVHETTLAHPHLAEMLLKTRTGETLTSIEQEQFLLFANRLVNLWVSIEHSNRQGALDPSFFSTICEDVRVAVLNWPGMQDNIRRIVSHYPGVESYEIFRPVFDARRGHE